MTTRLIDFPSHKDSAREIMDDIQKLIDEADPHEKVEMVAIVRVGKTFSTLTTKSEDVVKFVGMLELFKLELLEMMS